MATKRTPERFDPVGITVTEAAREAGCSAQAIWRHIYKGALPVVRVGPFRRPRILRSEFARYLKA